MRSSLSCAQVRRENELNLAITLIERGVENEMGLKRQILGKGPLPQSALDREVDRLLKGIIDGPVDSTVCG